uniref:Uncharacterized protein n=1 Tax=Setaria italica TaxID=4555 RepID=K3Z7W7_SETIT
MGRSGRSRCPCRPRASFPCRGGLVARVPAAEPAVAGWVCGWTAARTADPSDWPRQRIPSWAGGHAAERRVGTSLPAAAAAPVGLFREQGWKMISGHAASGSRDRGPAAASEVQAPAVIPLRARKPVELPPNHSSASLLCFLDTHTQTLGIRTHCSHGCPIQGRAGADRAPGRAARGAAAGRRAGGRPVHGGHQRPRGGGARGGQGVRGARVLQGDGPRRAAAASGARRGRGHRLLRAAAAGEGEGRRGGGGAGRRPVRVQQQADRRQRRPRLGRVPPARRHGRRRRCCARGVARRAAAVRARGGVALLFPRSSSSIYRLYCNRASKPMA